MRCSRQRLMWSQNSVFRKSDIRNQWRKIPITPTDRDRTDRHFYRGAVPLYSAPATRTASAAHTCTDSAASPPPARRLPPSSHRPLCPALAVRASSAPVAAAMAADMIPLGAAARAAAARAATARAPATRATMARAAARMPTAARASTTARAPSSAWCPTCVDFVS
jgi:hypothetical protein